jgi:hypothetical protein
MGAPKRSSKETDRLMTSLGGYKKPGCDLWRVEASVVDRSLLETTSVPFIIDGLTSNWSALHGWHHEAILRDHGPEPFHLHSKYNRSLAELLAINGKYHMGHAVYPRRACYSDPWRPYTPFLHDQLASSFHLPPFLQPMSTFQMGIGRGFGVGVPPENHPSSWFAMVVGTKRWLLHPDTEREPPEMMQRHPRSVLCEPRAGMKTPTTLDCIQKAGDVIWVPNYWWHETCGIEDFSAGIGGITYKGCCDDLERAVPVDVDCTTAREQGDSYGISDIPFCQTEPGRCGSL